MRQIAYAVADKYRFPTHLLPRILYVSLACEYGDLFL